MHANTASALWQAKSLQAAHAHLILNVNPVCIAATKYAANPWKSAATRIMKQMSAEDTKNAALIFIVLKKRLKRLGAAGMAYAAKTKTAIHARRTA